MTQPVWPLTGTRFRLAAGFLVACSLIRTGWVYGGNLIQFRGEGRATVSAAPAPESVHLLKGIDSYAKVAPFVSRFDALKPRLPQRGAVGFVSDLPPGDPQRDLVLTMVRYALVPVKVDDDASLPLTIGVFDDPRAVAQLGSAALERVATYDEGLILFRKKKA